MGLLIIRTVLGVLLIILSATSIQAQSIKVTLLGTGTPKLSFERFGPSTLVEAGTEKLLFDCGRGSTLRMQQLGLRPRDVTSMFLTHLHSDHIVGIPDQWLTGWQGERTEPFRIWGPTGTKEMMHNLEKAYQVDIHFRIDYGNRDSKGGTVLAEDITEGVVYEKDGVKVTAFLVDHGPVVKPALGYRIDYQGRSVAISGDTRFCENLIKFSKGVDLLVHEVVAAKEELINKSEAVRRIIAYHTTPEEAGRVFDRVKPKLAVYSHIALPSTPAIDEVTEQDLITRTRKTYAGPLEVGEDLMTIEVGDKIEVRRFTSPSHE
ncbi:MAG: MBL fold metallo-hydrolase [Ignavibacteriae bacterium]|nr:MAG: MBL fold metallo-hydrolase [Ignavibacteriota bacterium]